MKQTVFETRQRAEQLIQQASSIWQRSAFSEQLEDLSKDPVYSLLMTALAYQANEMDSEVERLKQDIVEDISRLFVPYEMLYAVPATTVVEATPAEGIQQLDLSADNTFTLEGTKHTFIPLCRTTLFRTRAKSITRLDGRRWKVTLAFEQPVSNISGFSFAIRNARFRDLSVSIDGKPLPISKPSDLAQLPFDPAFGVNSMLYNNLHAHVVDTASIDLFARQNVNLFFVKPHADGQIFAPEQEKLDLVFEFSGISDTFSFGKANIVLNSVLLANVQIHTATLSPKTPIVRAVGGNGNDDQTEQFMHLICPSEDQLYGDSTIEVRRVTADRFNQGALLRLIGALKAKYHTDYRAFSDIASEENDDTTIQLQQLLARLEETVLKQTAGAVPGVYLILRDYAMDKQGSVDIQYLTTSGADVNDLLTPDKIFISNNGLEGRECTQVAEPVPGSNEVHDYVSGQQMARYLVATGDRIVTPVDIRWFCYKELQTRYGITREMVEHIEVSNRLSNDPLGPGYEIVVEIQLLASSVVQRALAEKLNQVETLLQKMMEVRSTNVYPISVTISLAETKNE